jgi:hypothetical protein
MATAMATPSTSAARPLDLANATLDLPTRLVGPPECQGGHRVTFRSGKSGDLLTLEVAGTADVDHDGATDHVAVISCRPGEGFLRQVVAFHGRPDGSVVTIGVIAQNEGTTAFSASQIQNIFRTLVAADGTISVEVGDYKSTYTSPTDQGIHQMRGYRWDGTRFVQVTGSVRFAIPLSAAHLSVTVSDLAVRTGVGLGGGMNYVGTVTVTVINRGGTPTQHLSVHLSSVAAPVNFGDGCNAGSSADGDCQIDPIPPGKTITVMLRVDFRDQNPQLGVNDTMDLQVRIGDQKCYDKAGLRLVRG